ncbi:7TM-DISM domain-containing protein [Thiohalophilus sp.]|uniref:7TMR-DISMED2 domain-containing protein n=1 Tax=Thiohalophilus sp. TaxID=3028392 RepID=UPI003A1030F1
MSGYPNSGNENSQSWVLHQCDEFYLDEITVYYAENDGLLRKRILSDRQPFMTRQLDYRNLAFSHTTPADSYTDLYIKLRFTKADAMSLQLLPLTR